MKFITFNGNFAQLEKAMQFIRQFNAAFGSENFLESSKLKNVSLHLTGTASAWWEALVRDGTGPKHWKGFKKAFYSQFLPKPFKKHVIRAWDSLHMDENETIDEYNHKFWDYYLQVLPFRKVSQKVQIEKYSAGLIPKIQTQVNAQKHKKIQDLMHAATVANLVQM